MSEIEPMDAEGGTMYQSLKARYRKPSAKVLENVEVVTNVSKPVAAPHGVNFSGKQRLVNSLTDHLKLQSGVAEVVVNDPDEEDQNVVAREFPITIEVVRKIAKEDRIKSEVVATSGNTATSPVVSTAGGSTSSRSSKPAATESNVAPFMQKEEENPDNFDDDMVSSAGSRNGGHGGLNNGGLMIALHSPDVKRKRGRPFKGQEKPVEERLLIETTKIRRLIDDIIRKGSASEFCVKLRTIARDIDDVLALAAAKNGLVLDRGDDAFLGGASPLSDLRESASHVDDENHIESNGMEVETLEEMNKTELREETQLQ